MLTKSTVSYNKKKSISVSIITVVYNNAPYIKGAIESVLSQNYNDIEYIVIDGGSVDGTIEVVKSFKDRISHFISEPDTGIYDALNKGVMLATGDVIAFLHSDDTYENKSVISDAVVLFDHGTQGVYGDLVYTDKYNMDKILRHWKSCDFSLPLLKKGWMPPHPTFFIRREIYQKYGGFDQSFKISGDYDFMLRILSKNISVKYIPKTLYRMRVGGESNKSILKILQKSEEDLKVLKKNNIGGLYALLYKNISKIPQFLFNKKP